MADSACNLVLADLASIPQRLDEFVWKPLGPGVELSSLHQDADGHTKLALLRYAPGATVPEHVHRGMEYIQILAGSQQDERGVYRAGTLVVSFPGTRHSVASPEGCVVLAVWEAPVQFV
ncbi:MAG: cupin domain-containing protein [Pseudomonadota bacterium]|jgi:predicted ChrR family anti-sigma factor